MENIIHTFAVLINSWYVLCYILWMCSVWHILLSSFMWPWLVKNYRTPYFSNGCDLWNSIFSFLFHSTCQKWIRCSHIYEKKLIIPKDCIAQSKNNLQQLNSLFIFCVIWFWNCGGYYNFAVSMFEIVTRCVVLFFFLKLGVRLDSSSWL